MRTPLCLLLSRWEVNPPVVFSSEADQALGAVFGLFRSQGLLRPLTPAHAADCRECGRRCRVEFVVDQTAAPRSFIHCHSCGLAEVPAGQLERWEVDTGVILATLFSAIHLTLNQRVPGQLWQVGKAFWTGSSREVWFARGFRRGHVADTLTLLQSRPKAILFVPTEVAAEHWREVTGNLIIPLEMALTWDALTISLDREFIEGRIVDAGLSSNASGQRRPKKRAERAANIESLRKEIVEHLRAARDYAFATREQFGTPALLPRPTQKALGKRVGLSEPDVSRCLRDPEARELRLYWNTALDLDQLMTWKGPLTKGRNA